MGNTGGGLPTSFVYTPMKHYFVMYIVDPYLYPLQILIIMRYPKGISCERQVSCIRLFNINTSILFEMFRTFDCLPKLDVWPTANGRNHASRETYTTI